MSDLFTKIANFYGGDSFLKANFTDLCFLVCDIGRSLIDGSAIEVKSFDGYLSKSKRIEQISRLDTIVALGRLSALLETKLATLPEKELAHLDRMRDLSQKSELPKRLSDPNL